jgi:hypothetical protein
MEIEFTVKMDVSEQYAALLDKTNIGGSLGHFRNVIQVALNEIKEEFPDIIATVFVDGVDNSGEGGHGRREYPRPPVVRESGDRGAVVASAPRKERSEGMGPAKRPGVRTGRPATLHDHSASDGQPVRAAGPRSVENLTAQGVKVYRMVDGRKRLVTEQDGAVWTEGNATLPEATPKRSKNDRPPVISRRRGA